MANPPANRAERLLLAAAGMAAALMLVLAVPRVIGGSLAALAPPAGAGADTLPALAAAQGWAWSARVAELQVWRAAASGAPELRPLVEQALARAPINPTHWTLLADQRQRAGDTAGAIDAMRMSLIAGPIDPALAPYRLMVALPLRDAMATDDRALLDRQIQLSYVLRPAHVGRLMGDPRMAEPIRAAVTTLSPMDIEHMVRIHALH